MAVKIKEEEKRKNEERKEGRKGGREEGRVFKSLKTVFSYP